MLNYNLYPQYNMPTNGLKGRLVSSIDEAKVAQIDFDGSLFIFPDLANKKIYTKQVGMDGMAIINSYALERLPETKTDFNYVTKEELANTIEEIKKMIGNKQSVVLDI